VATDNSDDLAVFDFKGNVLQCPEVFNLFRAAAENAAKRRQRSLRERVPQHLILLDVRSELIAFAEILRLDCDSTHVVIRFAIKLRRRNSPPCAGNTPARPLIAPAPRPSKPTARLPDV